MGWRATPGRSTQANSPAWSRDSAIWSLGGTAGTTPFFIADEKFGRRVSLIAVPANSPAREEQFELVRTAAERSVPGVAAVHDWVSTPSFDYFVLDKLEGEPLDRILTKLGPRDVAQTARIAIQVAEAIEFLTFGSRSSGIITPQNVVVKADGTASLAPLALPSYAVLEPAARAFRWTLRTGTLYEGLPCGPG